MKTLYKINGEEIKRPWPFKQDQYDITKASRSTTGLMNMDIIATKRKFYLSWDVLDMYQVQQLMRLIASAFFEFEYVEDNVVKTATCYKGAISKTMQRSGSVWYWKRVTVNFIER